MVGFWLAFILLECETVFFNVHDIQEIQFRVIWGRKSVNLVLKKSQAFAYCRYFLLCNPETRRTHKYELLYQDRDQTISFIAMT